MLDPHVALERLKLHEGRMTAHLTLELHASSELDRMHLVDMPLQVEHLLKLPLIRADVAEEGRVCRNVLLPGSDLLLVQLKSNIFIAWEKGY